MRRSRVALFLAMGLSLVLIATSAWCFNPLAHIFIAEQVFSDCREKVDLHYGSIAPDLALSFYGRNAERWISGGYDTHCYRMDLRPYAYGRIQKAFAKGWRTHNEEWGADFYAHINYKVGEDWIEDGYVYEKAGILTKLVPDLDDQFAAFAIEAIVDFLLKRRGDHELGEKLLKADFFRSWQDRWLLTKVFVLKEDKTDWTTLVSAESAFRNLVSKYAMVMALPPPLDKEALIQLGVQLAQEMYGIDVTAYQLRMLLDQAIDLCRDDYSLPIGQAIDSIRSNW